MSSPAPDLAVLVLGTPAPSRRHRARTALIAGAVAVAVTAGVVAVVGGRMTPSPALRPVAVVRADTGLRADVQQFTAAGSYTLKKPKRDGFTALEQDVAAAAGAGAAVAPIALGPATPAGAAQTYAAAAVKRHGWSASDFSCLVALWNRESGWNTHAGSPGGAYGIPQSLPGSKMGAAGGDWVNSAQVQIDWGLGYIAGRYGHPCGAWAQSEATGSY